MAMLGTEHGSVKLMDQPFLSGFGLGPHQTGISFERGAGVGIGGGSFATK